MLAELSWALVILCFTSAYLSLFIAMLPAVLIAGVGFVAYHSLLSESELGTTFWVSSALIILFTLAGDLLKAKCSLPGRSRYGVVLWATLVSGMTVPLLGWIFSLALLFFLLVPSWAEALLFSGQESPPQRKRWYGGSQLIFGALIGSVGFLLPPWQPDVAPFLPILPLLLLFFLLLIEELWRQKQGFVQSLLTTVRELITFLARKSVQAFIITALICWFGVRAYPTLGL